MDINKLKFPVGHFSRPVGFDTAALNKWINTIEQFPSKINALSSDLTEIELGFHYRTDGWTVRQVIHHCADSHMNSFVRFKLSLTEDLPQIKPYHEAAWAELSDTLSVPILSSLKIIEGLHFRWTILLKNMSESDFARSFTHPEMSKPMSLYEATAMYAWHCQHHYAHIEQALVFKDIIPS